MWRKAMEWLRRRLHRPEPAEVKPHPPQDTDRGAREHIEMLMEAESRHAGARR